MIVKLNKVVAKKDEEDTDSRYILKVEMSGLTNKLDVRSDEKLTIKENSWVSGLSN